MFHPSQHPTPGFARLYDLLNSTQFTDGDDSISCFLTNSNNFTVKSCYAILNDGECRSLYKKSIWKSAAPLKVKIFGWLMCHDKILSKTNLHKRGWTGSLYCDICRYPIVTMRPNGSIESNHGSRQKM